MGLAASQGRFLCLTARLNDLVYEGQQISQQRMALAEETSRIAKEYTAAVNNKKMQCTTPAGGTQPLTYDIITDQDPSTGLCMRIVDTNGYVVTKPREPYLEVKSVDADGNEVTNKIHSTIDFIDNYFTGLTTEQRSEYSTKSLSEIKKLYEETYPDSELTITLNTLKNEDERYLFDENCTNPEYLQDMLSSGQWLLQQIVKPASGDEPAEWGDYMWQGSSMIQEVYDTSDDAAAEAAYEAAMIDLNKKDKMLELRLEDIQTQEQSVEKQIDSIKQVIKENIEDTYKTFA